ncbi:aromatic hydrocarbon degradation protein [Leptospira gomenensis]|uniref:Aromatic hydrocarbon degradation protein n=1 Tax=Leptospira gomenensis TaxID=2484974 RepID=A0A5F1Z1V3_9LEPT|nr:outer membrane protein transport protein [Leptospira gomenensis]TGK28777.1 aromatic hydrocarbon degradation protein [Leptospira gomenensis]TGK37636.1 aromatic hydrocarbon degradation protein [Leptospira gomenensis]TGK51535.1 aromatic hydrocarbon degradation protein [Leptospira gomenensis]TGK68092.1 aromatic hydrocarbon degradation protein [Leptospira gomenensis]
MEHLKLKRILEIGVLFGIVLRNDLHAGSYGDIYGAHPAAAGMGSAVTAIVNNSSAVFYNPAGLGRLSEGDLILAGIEKEARNKDQEIPENKDTTSATQTADSLVTDPATQPIVATGPWYKRLWGDTKEGFTKDVLKYKPLNRPERNVHELTFQYHYANPTSHTTAPRNQSIDKIQDSFVGLGLTLNLNDMFDIGRGIRFGINALVPGSGNLLTINDQNPTVPRYLQQGISNERPTIMGGLGLEIWKDRIFAGIGFTALAGGSGSILMKDVPISPDPVSPNSQVILTVKPLVNPTYGLQFTYGKFSLGASYKRETLMQIDPVPARAQATVLGIQLDFDLAILDGFNPRVFSYGIAFRPNDRLVLSLDANREIWSQFKVSRIKEKYSEAFYLHDTTNFRIGAEYALFKFLKTRLGFATRPTPLPSMPGTNNWMDSDRNIFSLGFSYIFSPTTFRFMNRLKKPIVFDLVVENHQLKAMEVNKYNPTERNPNYAYGGYIWSVGVSMTIFF